MKIEKATAIKLGLVLTFILGTVGFIFIKVYRFKKEQAEKVSIMQDPAMNSKKDYEGIDDASRNDLTRMLYERENRKDSVKQEVKPEVVKPTENVKKREVKPQEKKEEPQVAENLFAKVDKLDSKERKPVPKPKEVKREPEPAPVKFNFVVVKEDKETVKAKSAESEEEPVKLFAGKVYGTQRIKTNEPVSIRSTEPFTVEYPKKATIPSGSIFHGVCTLQGNRMYIKLTSCITIDGDMPVDIEVFDSDYQRGIFIREGIETGIEENPNLIVEEATQNMPNQLAGTVIRNTSRKMQRSLNKQNRITVTLEDGYSIYLAARENKNRRR